MKRSTLGLILIILAWPILMPYPRRPRLVVGTPAPILSAPPFETGIASWYGKEFQGSETTSGTRFNMYALTAAHRTLPLGTRVRVTNLLNEKSVILLINDRGPVPPGRIIDLSYAAARRLHFSGQGLAPVSIALLPPKRLASNDPPAVLPAR